MRSYFARVKTVFNNLSLQVKLVVLLCVAGIGPLVFASVFSYRSMYRNLSQQANSNMTNTSRQISSNIGAVLGPVNQISSLLYNSKDIRNYLTLEYAQDIDWVVAYKHIDEYLYSFMIANANIQHITFYIPNVSIPADGFFVRHMVDFPVEAWKNHGEAGQELECFSVTRKNGVDLLLLGRPLNYGQGEDCGYLVISVRESTIANLFSQVNDDYCVYVTDAQGTILSVKDKTRMNTSVMEHIPALSLKEDAGGFIGEVDGRKSMVVYTSAPGGWKTIVATPMESIHSSVNASMRQLLSVSILCVLVALLLVMQISNYFSSRFSLLNQQIDMVKNNDFSFYIQPMGNDEIGQLGDALNKMARTLNSAINEVYKKEIQQKETQLQLLQSQINPHFLYNALSCISSLALIHKDKATSEFAAHLSQFYKLSLNSGKQFVTIREEISITQHYISIQQTRFAGMFHFCWDVDETLLGLETPKLILQPFIENIINHAATEGNVTHAMIRVAEEYGRIRFTVSDDGAGIPEDTLKGLLDPERAKGYGLLNVDQRIKLAYGSQYGVILESALGKGTTAYITVAKDSQHQGGTVCLSL